jgi:hypothetical protein
MEMAKVGMSPDGKTITMEEQRITASKSGKPAQKRKDMSGMGVLGAMNSPSAKDRDMAIERMLDTLEKAVVGSD